MFAKYLSAALLTIGWSFMYRSNSSSPVVIPLPLFIVRSLRATSVRGDGRSCCSAPTSRAVLHQSGQRVPMGQSWSTGSSPALHKPEYLLGSHLVGLPIWVSRKL